MSKKKPVEIVICNYVSPVTNIKCNKPTKYPQTYKSFVPTCAEHTPRLARTTNEFAIVDLTAVEINGILFYIDKYHNVYHTDDVIMNKTEPRIIAKWRKENGETVFDLDVASAPV